MANVTTNNPYFENTTLDLNQTYNSNELVSVPLYYAAKYLTVFFQPLVCAFGILGNLLSVVIFLSKDLRKISSNIYLTALSASSCLFLVSVFCVWLEVVKVPIMNKPVWCQTVVFVTYVCSFLSVWFIVCITVENYIVTFHLEKTTYFCTVRRARIVVLCFTCIGISLYFFALWSTKVVRLPEGMYICTEDPEYAQLTKVFTYIDSIVTLFFPSILTVILLVAILVKTIFCRGRRSDAFRRISKMERSLIRVTRVLLAISLAFVISSAPSQINKLKHLLFRDDTQTIVTLNDRSVQQICQIIYYTSFSFNFIFYLTWSANYRKGVKKLFGFKKTTAKLGATALSAFTNGNPPCGNDKSTRSAVTAL